MKIITDIAMTVLLLLLMSYSLIGEAAHEWLGIGMFVLFVLHHILIKNQFVFFDYGEPLILFLLDYIAAMGLFVFIGHYIGQGLKWIDRKMAIYQGSK